MGFKTTYSQVKTAIAILGALKSLDENWVLSKLVLLDALVWTYLWVSLIDSSKQRPACLCSPINYRPPPLIIHQAD